MADLGRLSSELDTTIDKHLDACHTDAHVGRKTVEWFGDDRDAVISDVCHVPSSRRNQGGILSIILGYYKNLAGDVNTLMEIGDLIAIRPEFVPEGKRRRAFIFLGMKRRFFSGVIIEDYMVLDLKGKHSQVPYKVIERCEVVSQFKTLQEV